MNFNQPVTEARLQLILRRLHSEISDWESVFAPAPEPPQVAVPIAPPQTPASEAPLTADEIAQVRRIIGSSETGPWTSAEVDTVHRLAGGDKASWREVMTRFENELVKQGAAG